VANQVFVLNRRWLDMGFKRHIFAVIIILPFFFPSYGFTEAKEIISEGTYNMGDGETPTVAESRALLQAKRIAVEQAGTYLESYTKVENLQLTKDEIHVLASGIMEVMIIDKKRTIVGDGFNFWVKIKAKINLDDIEKMAGKVKERAVVEDYKKIQEAYDKSQKDIEELKKQLAQAKGEKEKKKVEAKITDEERLFQANEWSEKGHRHWLNKEYDSAIEAFTSVIALDPNDAHAYNIRGITYSYKGQYDRAIEDYNKAIALDPNDFGTYFNRGNAYDNKGQHDRAIDDYNKAIELDPNFAYIIAEINALVGLANNDKGHHNTAIKDCNKAIELNPNLAAAYWCLGAAYNGKGQYDKAIENYNRAIALKPDLAGVFYAGRGFAYFKKGQYDRAIEDYNRAIALDLNDAQTYTNRGVAYFGLGNRGRAIADFQKACDMGDEDGCKALEIALNGR
jgi:tetratricopeptide (TPR) repeat protein